MGLFRNPPPVVDRAEIVHTKDGLTAASAKIEFGDRSDREAMKRRPFDWQNEAWRYFDELPEINFAGTYVGNAMSRVRLIPAYQDIAGAPPVALDLDSEELPDDADLTAAALATQNIARLSSGTGGTGDLMRGFGMNLFLPGEAVLVGRQTSDGEEWRVYSTEEIRPGSSGEWRVRTDPTASGSDDAGEALSPDTFALHVWRRHPRWSDLPQSPMRGVLELCDELQILTRMIRGAALSSLNAGIMFIPKGMLRRNATAGDTDGKSTDKDQFLDDLIEYLTTPIKDPRSAAAVAPNVIAADKDDIEAVRRESFDRPVDEAAAEQRGELVRRIATGLDLPPEILTGKADVNHWTAWSITEDAFRSHIEPLAILVCQALTTGFLWPSLRIGNVPNPERYVVWYDASDLVVRPNEAENARMGHDSFVLSDDTYRRALGYGPDDAPDDEEIVERVRIQQALKGPSALPPARGPDDDEVPERVAPAPSGGPPELPAAPEEDEGPAMAVVTAAVAADTVAVRLAEIDRSLRLRVQQAADEATRSALARAGARLRTLATRRKDALAQQIVATTDNAAVAEALGPTVVAALVDDDDPALSLLAGAFDSLEGRWHKWVRRAMNEIRTEIERAADAAHAGLYAAADLPPEWEDEFAADTSAGWNVLVEGLSEGASALLFNVSPAVPAGGEFDADTLVPPGTVRSAIVRAGGGSSATLTISTGLSTGKTAHDLMGRNGMKVGRYVWLYGDPMTRQKPFEPHRQLDGVLFDSLHDPRLANTGGVWPGVSYFQPGDHTYCQCDFGPSTDLDYEQRRPPTSPDADPEPAAARPPTQRVTSEPSPWHPADDVEIADNQSAMEDVIGPDVQNWDPFAVMDVDAPRYKANVAQTLARRMKSPTEEFGDLDYDNFGGKWRTFARWDENDPDLLYGPRRPPLAYRKIDKNGKPGGWEIYDEGSVDAEFRYMAHYVDADPVHNPEAFDAFDVRDLTDAQLKQLVGWGGSDVNIEFVWGGTAEAQMLSRESVVSNLIQRWAVSSNDEDSLSLALQELIRRKFDLDGTFDWTISPSRQELIDEILDKHGSLLDDFVGSMYDETQAALAAANVSEVKVVRGFNWEGIATDQRPDWVYEIQRTTRAGQFGEANVSFRPASSFSSSREVAAAFAGHGSSTRVYMQVPADRILGMPRTGWGCLGEHEWVVLGGTYRVAGT